MSLEAQIKEHLACGQQPKPGVYQGLGPVSMLIKAAALILTARFDDMFTEAEQEKLRLLGIRVSELSRGRI